MIIVVMALLTAFTLGLVGSLHCAGMCGPLVLAVPMTGNSGSSRLVGRGFYHAGRMLTYGVLGAILGLVGATLALAGWQRWISLGAGTAILAGLALSSRVTLNRPATKSVGWLKGALSALLHRRTLASLFCLGSLNGLLPCGLVYVAAAAAIASGGLMSSVGYMVAFGLGTLPMMLGIGLVGGKLQAAIRFKSQSIISFGVALVGVLLILRGLSLGIPLLSPDLEACH